MGFSHPAPSSSRKDPPAQLQRSPSPVQPISDSHPPSNVLYSERNMCSLGTSELLRTQIPAGSGAYRLYECVSLGRIGEAIAGPLS